MITSKTNMELNAIEEGENGTPPVTANGNDSQVDVNTGSNPSDPQKSAGKSPSETLCQGYKTYEVNSSGDKKERDTANVIPKSSQISEDSGPKAVRSQIENTKSVKHSPKVGESI
mmetsp:Transcript_24563/g.24417  ORF Transcript_24563/g.24417 Transcript_24563/m.24417 type:complete len:115 (+) Transcript_24563:2-346(+)